MTDLFENELRRKNPARWKAIDYGRSPTKAIKAFCQICMGSTAEAAKCTSYTCPLFAFRPFAKVGDRPDGNVPTEAEYDAMIAAQPQREMNPAAAAALKAWRGKGGDDELDDVTADTNEGE
jgi:hypothetical protein